MKKLNNFRATLLIIISIFIGLILIIILKKTSFSFSDSSSLYFYSAHLQANAAILSIYGVLIIFRIQSLKSNIDVKMNGLFNLLKASYIIEFDVKTLLEKKQKIDDLKNRDSSSISAADRYFISWFESECKIREIKNSFKPTAIFVVISIILNSICLASSKFLNESGFIVEFSVMYLNEIFEVIILILMINIARKTVL